MCNVWTGVNVPRRRFLPVKTTSDLLIIMSNLYSLRTGYLEMNPKRSFPSVPLVKLGTSFSKVCQRPNSNRGCICLKSEYHKASKLWCPGSRFQKGRLLNRPVDLDLNVGPSAIPWDSSCHWILDENLWEPRNIHHCCWIYICQV